LQLQNGSCQQAVQVVQEPLVSLQVSTNARRQERTVLRPLATGVRASMVLDREVALATVRARSGLKLLIRPYRL